MWGGRFGSGSLRRLSCCFGGCGWASSQGWEREWLCAHGTRAGVRACLDNVPFALHLAWRFGGGFFWKGMGCGGCED